MTIDQINKWNLRHAYLIMGLIIFTLITKRIELLSLGAIISFSSLIHQGSKSLSKLNPPGGYANWVTGFRLIIVLVGSFLFSIISKEMLFGLMISAVLLDVADGILARKFGHASTFGQFFDMEVDAFFVLIMCFYYYTYEQIGWWILIPGVMRYLYKLMIVLIPKKEFIEKKQKYAATIAGIFFTILAISLLLDMPYSMYTLLVGSIMLVFSFSKSIFEYLRF